MAKPPFDLVRAVFFLLATILLFELAASILAGVLCWVTNWYGERKAGVCLPIDNVIRELWSELLTAVLALLLAARNTPPPPPPSDKGNPTDATD